VWEATSMRRRRLGLLLTVATATNCLYPSLRTASDDGGGLSGGQVGPGGSGATGLGGIAGGRTATGGITGSGGLRGSDAASGGDGSMGTGGLVSTGGHTGTGGVSVPELAVFAGVPSGEGSADGTGAAARFYFPKGVAVDAKGNLFVADGTIRKITPAGVVTTIAGSANGSSGSEDGTGAAARFLGPSGLAVDGAGNVYVADSGNNTIRKVTPAGVVTTLAGKAGSTGSADGMGTTARFAQPEGVAVDGAGNVFVADSLNSTIRKITPAGLVSTLAGTAGSCGSADATGTSARFCTPQGVAVDPSGNVFVADYGNHTIRRIMPNGLVITFAGSASSGSEDGTGTDARFARPTSVAVDAAGNLLVVDFGNNTIRKITPSGVVTTLAGKADSSGSEDGTGAVARFNSPQGVAVDAAGNVYVTDSYNHTIRKVTPAGVVNTLAGTADSSGSADGMGSAARFDGPVGVAVDGVGNVFVAEHGNCTIRKVTRDGMVTTVAGTAGVFPVDTDGTGFAARFRFPSGLAVDGAGNLYVADSGASTIRKITPAGVVTTIAGTVGLGDSADGTGAAARFSDPEGVAVDAAGNVYVADTFNSTIRRITPSGVVTTLAGTAGLSGSADGTGPAARFRGPEGVAVDAAGNVVVADSSNHTIRKITPVGEVTTLAGTAGLSGSADGAGSAARFYFPHGVAVDGVGDVFVTDSANNAIRRISTSGMVTTVAGGVAPTKVGNFPGPLPASIVSPEGVAIDPSTGKMFITVGGAVMVATLPN
jgi:streptogramin lyase